MKAIILAGGFGTRIQPGLQILYQNQCYLY